MILGQPKTFHLRLFLDEQFRGAPSEQGEEAAVSGLDGTMEQSEEYDGDAEDGKRL